MSFFIVTLLIFCIFNIMTPKQVLPKYKVQILDFRKGGRGQRDIVNIAQRSHVGKENLFVPQKIGVCLSC